MATILIVDDQPTNRELLLTLLGYGDHRLLEAADGSEALTITRAVKPDLVIADLLMPVMDGYEFARQVRAAAEIRDTRIIFFTATYLEDEARRLAKACGVEHLIVKPAEAHVVNVFLNMIAWR